MFLEEKALTLLAGWPSTTGDELFASFLAEIRRQIEAADDPDQRSRLEKVLDTATGIGRDVFVGVFTALATQQTQRIGK